MGGSPKKVGESNPPQGGSRKLPASMLSKFEVRFCALVFWDTFRLGVGGCNWSARGMISFSFQLVTEHRNFVNLPACSLCADTRGVVEAIRAHTAYGYFDTACGSVWVVIEVRMGSN